MELGKSPIKELLSFDSLDAAEKLTGKSYKESDETAFLGMLLMMQNSKEKEKMMKSLDDTCFSETTEEYMRKIKRIGFEVVYEEEFINKDGRYKKPEKENFYICWHKEYSILLKWDTYWGKRNSAKMYYNWSPNDMCSTNGATSSGHYFSIYYKPDLSGEMPYTEVEPRWEEGQKFEDLLLLKKEWSARRNNFILCNQLKAIWSGDHDAREALGYNINCLLNNGKFVEKWVEIPFLWFATYAETEANKDSDEEDWYEKINKTKIEKLPDFVKEAMGPYKK